MTLIRMLRMRYGTANYYSMACYQRGKRYLLADGLAGYFIRHGDAVPEENNIWAGKIFRTVSCVETLHWFTTA